MQVKSHELAKPDPVLSTPDLIHNVVWNVSQVTRFGTLFVAFQHFDWIQLRVGIHQSVVLAAKQQEVVKTSTFIICLHRVKSCSSHLSGTNMSDINERNWATIRPTLVRLDLTAGVCTSTGVCREESLYFWILDF
jgi:hypothetical protein